VNELAVTVVGHDRPGIIAEVAKVLAGLQLNLTDSTMTLLRGHFAMTLVCAVQEGPDQTAEGVRTALAPLVEGGTLAVTVSPVPEERPVAPDGVVSYTLTVYGADRLGIVAEITGALAALGGNITDLTTRLSGALYLLSAEVDLPAELDPDVVLDQLDQIAAELGVEVSLRPTEADVL
jgi:glycine cleavage system transcriptional repressor